jgi:hypothetical protein
MFSDGELQLIQTVFADNEELLYAIRKVFLQFPLTEAEKESIKAQVTPEVFTVLKKKLLPEVSPDAPFGQLADLRQTLTNDLKTRTLEDMDLLMEAKDLETCYLKQQMAALRDICGDIDELANPEEQLSLDQMGDLDPLKPVRERFVGNTARNFILGFVDPMLRDFIVLAGTKTESVEKKKERLTRNSAK